MQNDDRQMAEEQHEIVDESNVVFPSGLPQTILVQNVHSTKQQLTGQPGMKFSK